MSTNEVENPGSEATAQLRRWFHYYGYFILKNLIGWLLILAAGPIGVMLPGPGGLPLFLIGFAMITFPGKRALTARVLRGIPIDRQGMSARYWHAVLSIFLPAFVIYAFSIRFNDELQRYGPTYVWSIYALAVCASVIIIHLGVRLCNYGLAFVPAIRRRVRPWMRRRGIDLLPPRRRKRFLNRNSGQREDKGILEVDSRHTDNLKSIWQQAKPWVGRVLKIGLTLAIIYWMVQKTLRHWGDVKDRASELSVTNFIIASAMFSLFLFAVRALSWRRIILGFGHKLAVGPTVRIWSTSELARYVPGSIFQVLGRAYLAKPYGISKTECAASQILELVIFLLANILIGTSCLMFFGLRNIHGAARVWLFALTASVPLLALLIHPKVFYGIMDRIMRKMGRPPLAQRLAGKTLLLLLLRAIVGLVWQNLAIYLIVAKPLDLPMAKFYVLSGAYCIAWCAGFIVVTAPGGLGVRELVFIGAMSFALPQHVRDTFSSEAVLKSFLAFLAGVLRLWTIAGELILTGIAYAVDYRGAMGKGPGQMQEQPRELVGSES